MIRWHVSPSVFSSALISRLHLFAPSQFAGWLISRAAWYRKKKKMHPTWVESPRERERLATSQWSHLVNRPFFFHSSQTLWRPQPPPTRYSLVKQLSRSNHMLFVFFSLSFIFYIYLWKLCLWYSYKNKYLPYFSQHIIKAHSLKHSTLFTRCNNFLINNVNCKWKCLDVNILLHFFFCFIATDIFYYCLLFKI